MFGFLCWFLWIFFSEMIKYEFEEDDEDAHEVDPRRSSAEKDNAEYVVGGGNGKPAAKEDNAKLTAPDGGYGWFVVLGCFISHIVGGGIERSDGVFFLQFIARFHKSAQLTSWPGAIMSTLNLCLAPVSSFICNRYSARTSVMIGGLLMSAGCILSGFATNFHFLFFSFGLLLGIGRGLSYAPGLILAAMYFDKRRGLATGIASSGVGIGTFIIVPTSQYLFDNYGFQGAFLIIGGIALHTNLAAMLYRPLSMHYLFVKRSTPHIFAVDHAETTAAIVPLETNSEIESLRSLRLKHSGTNETRVIESLSGFKAENTNAKDLEENPFLGSNIFSTAGKICFPTEIKDDDDKITRQLCHLYLLKNTPFLLYCLSTWLFSMAMKSGFMFIPALVISKGISESKASYVMSIAGVADCVSRIGAGFLLDLKLLRFYRLVVYTIVCLTMALVLFLLPFIDSFSSFVILCCVLGVLTGFYLSQRVVILVDILGIQHMANSLGILICFQSFGTLLGPPLSGAVKDHFGTFAEAYYFNGMVMVVAGILMSASGMFYRMQPRRSSL